MEALFLLMAAVTNVLSVLRLKLLLLPLRGQFLRGKFLLLGRGPLVLPFLLR